MDVIEMNTESPLVTVIIPSYNSEKFIRSTIESVLKQDYKNIEPIVIDGGSKDRTVKICREYEEIEFRNQPGTGISDALNYGIDISRGDIISFISSDDLWEKSKLTRQIELLINNPEIQLTVCKVKYFLESGCIVPSNFKKEFFEKDTVQYILETLVVRKDLFRKVGIFDPSFSAGMDVDWFARIFDMHVPLKIVNQTLVYKRVHDSNTALNTKKILNQSLRALHNSIKRKKNIKKDEGFHEPTH